MVTRCSTTWALTTLLCAVWAWPSMAAAQGPDNAQDVELEPIACYWRTSTDSVRVGDLFTLILTCGVIDTAATTVVPDQSRLDPGVLQLAPFEIKGGTQAPDLRTPTRRFFQYQYDLRYLGEEVGRDLQLPALTLSYRVQSRVQQDGAAVESRERQYILPAHTVRILSAVPATARDIREPSPVTLSTIDARRFRASMLRISALALYAVAAVFAGWAVVVGLRPRRTASAAPTRHVSDAAILTGVLRELGHVRRTRASDGWTDALAARALAATRIAASYAAGASVAQTPARASVPVLSGQIQLPSRWFGSGVLVSGAGTTTLLRRMHDRGSVPASQQMQLDDLTSAMTSFSTGVYGRAPLESDALDEALSSAERATGTIRRQHSWLSTRITSLTTRASEHAKVRGWQRS